MAIIALILLFLIPGLATLVALGPDSRRNLQFNVYESVLFVGLVSSSVLGWFAFVLAELGIYSPLLLASCASIYTVVIAANGWRELPLLRSPNFPRPGLHGILVAGLLVMASFLFLRPFEYTLGGLDPGVYVSTGANIAQTGAILIHDQNVSGLPPELRGSLFSELEKPWTIGSRHVGFYMRDFDGVVEPHGFHLFPVWIGILYSLGGLAFSLYAAPIFGVLGVLALYCLGRRVFNPWVGLLASALLTLNVATLWFARYPDAEILVQFLFLSAAWAFVVILDTPSKPLAVLSGLAFGLILLAKIELVIVPVVLSLYLMYLWMRGRFQNDHLFFSLTYCALLVHSLIHASLFASIYTLGVIAATVPSLMRVFEADAVLAGPRLMILFDSLDPSAWRLALAPIALLGAAILLSVLRRLRGMAGFSSALAGRYQLLTRYLSASSLVLGLAYAYYLRPTLNGELELPFPFEFLQRGDTTSLVKLAWITTPIGLLLVGLGLFLIISEGRRKGLFLLLGFFLAETSLLLYSGFITPLYFWAARRDIPIFVPLAMLFIGYALWTLQTRMIGALRFVVPVALGAVILASQVRASLPFLFHTEYAGSISKMDGLASFFPDNSVLLVEWSVEGNRFAAPLEYIHRRTSFFVPQLSVHDQRLSGLVSFWQQQGRRTFWLYSQNKSDLRLEGQTLSFEGTYSIVLPEADVASDSLPNFVRQAVAVFDVYELLPSPGSHG